MKKMVKVTERIAINFSFTVVFLVLPSYKRNIKTVTELTTPYIGNPYTSKYSLN